MLVSERANPVVKNVDSLEQRLAPAGSPLAVCMAKLAALHDHLCPRQVLGLRMGFSAGELLGLDLPRSDKRLLVFVETDGCLADAVSVATGCWLGHRTLRLIDQGKAAATFADTQTGRAVRIWPHPDARRRALERIPDARSRWHAQRDAYQIMDSTELLRAEPIQLDLDLAAIISRPGTRVACIVCGEEIVNERERVVRGLPHCRSCAGERYYRAAEDQLLGDVPLRPTWSDSFSGQAALDEARVPVAMV